MRGVVIYVRYVIVPTVAIIAAIGTVHIIGRIAKKLSGKHDRKDRR